MFRRIQQPGRMGLSDPTDVNDLGVIVGGQRLEHRLYYLALACCGFEHVEIVLGGENYPALASGLESALRLLCGAPREHRRAVFWKLSALFHLILTEKRCLGSRSAARTGAMTFLIVVARESPALTRIFWPI
jgi:hypothetical protein